MSAGKECWCGNETSTDNLANSTVQDQCSEPCVGNPSVQCGGACGLIVFNVSTLQQMKQNTLSTCASCPMVKGALADSVGATCKGGWYQPFSKKNFWSDDKNNANYFKCFKGICEAGEYLGDGATNGNYTVLAKCGAGRAPHSTTPSPSPSVSPSLLHPVTLRCGDSDSEFLPSQTQLLSSA